jgi:methionine sulfoxide reductase heme-binding subunit
MAHALGNGTDTGRVWFLSFAGCCALLVAAALVWRLRSNFSEYADA